MKGENTLKLNQEAMAEVIEQGLNSELFLTSKVRVLQVFQDDDDQRFIIKFVDAREGMQPPIERVCSRRSKR